MAPSSGRVPMLDTNGRFPDRFAPPAVAADAAAAATARTGSETAKAGAETARTGAETAKAGAEAARTGAEAALAGVPAAVETQITTPGTPTRTALNATYVGLVQAAKNPDLLIVGAITLDGSDLVTSAAVVWPDGTPGTLTITSRDGNGSVLAYNITYGSPVTKTFTQPPITRNANGAATNVPQIVVI